MSVSLILLASSWQISLDVDAESTGRLTARPSISITETVIGFLVFVACDSVKKKKVLLMAKQAVPHMNKHLLKGLIFISKSSTFSDVSKYSRVCVYVGVRKEEINKKISKSTRYFTAQYLQLQPGRGLSSDSIHPRASQPFSTVGSEASRGETDETLQVLQKKFD